MAPRLRVGSVVTKAAVSVAIALIGSEAMLRWFPSMLPGWYLERFPMHGVELLRPGTLARTPIEGLPLPIPVQPHEGPPPADLKELGLAPQSEDSDERRYPRIVLPADDLGMPNPEHPRHADVLLVGDSFGVAAGVEDPPALRALLATATGQTVYDLSVAGIGPVREEWLLTNVGFEMAPTTVVWVFFSGNDATLAAEPLVHRHFGATTWATAYPDAKPPAWRLLDLLSAVLEPAAPPPQDRTSPGFLLTTGSPGRRIWFHPDHLRQLRRSPADWNADLGWRCAKEVLARVAESCAERSIRFLLLYVPSKPEVYLPYVAPDPEQAWATASFTLAEPLESTPQELWTAISNNRDTLEHLFSAFCDEKGIEWLSASPPLEALARRGEIGYLVTDTHWHEGGQRAVLPLLVDALTEKTD